MKVTTKAAILAILAILLCLTIVLFTINAARSTSMFEAKYQLKTYTGIGSGVFKHGTIVKVEDGQPKVVGHFDDDSGAEYPGTVQIEEVK